jgi:hypothetical protein
MTDRFALDFTNTLFLQLKRFGLKIDEKLRKMMKKYLL